MRPRQGRDRDLATAVVAAEPPGQPSFCAPRTPQAWPNETWPPRRRPSQERISARPPPAPEPGLTPPVGGRAARAAGQHQPIHRGIPGPVRPPRSHLDHGLGPVRRDGEPDPARASCNRDQSATTHTCPTPHPHQGCTRADRATSGAEPRRCAPIPPSCGTWPAVRPHRLPHRPLSSPSRPRFKHLSLRSPSSRACVGIGWLAVSSALSPWCSTAARLKIVVLQGYSLWIQVAIVDWLTYTRTHVRQVLAGTRVDA